VNGTILEADEVKQMSADDQTSSHLRRHAHWRRGLLAAPGVLAIGIVAAACGSGSSSPPAAGTGSTNPPAGGAHTAAVVDAKSSGSLGTILVNNKGFTLYRLSTDSKNKSNCTGGCTSVWPPVLVTGSAMPVGGPGVSGLGTIKVAGGEQVTYNGMPLYTFTGDSSAGQANGQNVKDQWGTWFVVTTNGSSAPTTTTAPSGGGATTTTAGGGGGVGF
jgi:predicted lipoprotein with Yx(FWY)xxD motif